MPDPEYKGMHNSACGQQQQKQKQQQQQQQQQQQKQRTKQQKITSDRREFT